MAAKRRGTVKRAARAKRRRTTKRTARMRRGPTTRAARAKRRSAVKRSARAKRRGVVKRTARAKRRRTVKRSVRAKQRGPVKRTARTKRRGTVTRTTRTRVGRRWVRRVQETSNAMDLPRGIFTRGPRAIALGLKRAVARSNRAKGRTPYQSAMSMLSYHVNRSGRSLSRTDRARFDAAKRELRRAYGRSAA